MPLTHHQVSAEKNSYSNGHIVYNSEEKPVQVEELEETSSHVEEEDAVLPNDSRHCAQPSQNHQQKPGLGPPSRTNNKTGRGGGNHDLTENSTTCNLYSTEDLTTDTSCRETEGGRRTEAVLEGGDGHSASSTRLSPLNSSKPTNISKGSEEAGDVCDEVFQGRHLVEKAVYVLSVSTLIMLVYCVGTCHWLLPYYYTVSLPALILIRCIMYWKNKWQYFLIDLCYFGNILTIVYIWAVPDHPAVFGVLFGLSIGPLAWAIAIFRNSLVFHHTEKMTSAFIHFLPMSITYSIRWHASSTSRYWYKPFVSSHSEDITFIFTWLVLVPFAFFILHNLVYLLFMFVIMKPGPEYQHTYSYLTEGKAFSKVFGVCGPKYKGFLFYLAMYVYTLLTLLVGVLLYKYFIAHTIFMAICLLIALWNGASFYLDVFAYKGYKAET